ncbi:MAG: hypothetical protein HKN50_12365 [Gammaproteobacteria bacterium]|nr:hypothetical protein [Gammaproteobacteria bacterium]
MMLLFSGLFGGALSEIPGLLLTFWKFNALAILLRWRSPTCLANYSFVNDRMSSDNKIGLSLIVASIVTGYISQAAFTPAFILSIGFIAAGLVCLLKKMYKTAGALFVINGIALFGVSLIAS